MSGPSWFSALVLFVIALAALGKLRKSKWFFKVGGAPVLLAGASLVIVRLFVPLDIPFAYSYHSWNLLGVGYRFFRDNPAVVNCLIVAWAMGSIAIGGREIRDVVNAYRMSQDYKRVESPMIQVIANDLGISCPVVVTPDAPGHYVEGLFRYTIYMPLVDLPEEWDELILRHERQHILSHHAPIKVFYGVVMVLLWWTVVPIYFQKELNALLELHCDMKVLAGLDEVRQVTYSEMIVKMSKWAVATPEFALDRSGALGAPGAAEQRLKFLEGYSDNPPRRSREIIGILCALILFFASYLVVAQPAGAPPADMFEAETGISYLDNYDAPDVEGQISDSDAFILYGADGQYRLFVDYHFIKYLTYDEVVSEKYHDLWIFEEKE